MTVVTVCTASCNSKQVCILPAHKVYACDLYACDVYVCDLYVCDVYVCDVYDSHNPEEFQL
jgi:hypothetical protein